MRLPFERLMEHVMSQPWADTILAWEVDDVVYCGKTAVLEAETRAIQSELPLYNVRKNEQNPYRIIPPDAIRQRRARDLERGKPRWVHPDDRDLVSPAIRPAPQPRPTRRLKPWQIKTGLWSIAWALLTAAMWGGLHRFGLNGTWTRSALCACLASALMCWWAWWRPLDTWPRWRRRLRKFRRRLR